MFIPTKKNILLAGFCLSLICLINHAYAQPKKIVADKIIAQVGDKIILKSDIINAIADYKRQGQEASLPPNAECAFLEGQLIQKSLVIQAEKDSIPVSDEEVEAAMDNQIRGFIREFGSQQMLEEIAGKSIFQLKEEFKKNFKERKLSEKMKEKILDNIKVTPNEVKQFFDKIPKDSLTYYESELELAQIIVQPKANKDVEEYVIKELQDYKRLAETGVKKFEQLAKLNSEDPGSRENGGLYNINRGDGKSWDPVFFSTVFKLKEGQISNVIKSKFGFHIILLVSRSGDDAVVRHILKIPPVTEEEVKLALAKLDTIKNRIAKKEISFQEAVNLFSDDEASKFNNGSMQARDGSTYLTIDQLDKEVVIAIKDLKVGGFTKSHIFTDERGRKMTRFIYLKSRSNPHLENLKDDYNKIANRAIEEKKQQRLQTWFQEHLPNYYITIDKEFAECKTIGRWLKFINER